MILPNPKESRHKAWLYRLLMALLDEPEIASQIYFKGGTCAAMLGFLDRYSVDLDFDFKKGADLEKLREKFHQIFEKINLKVKNEGRKVLQFFLKYDSMPGQRNTLKLDLIDQVLTANQYQVQYLSEISRFANCQTIETMFAHKLVTIKDRFIKNETIAGRDIYDIHHFFLNGFKFLPEIIKRRTGLTVGSYFRELVDFIEKKVTQTIINEDLNSLLPLEKYQAIRNSLKAETLMFLKQEIEKQISDRK